MTNRQFAASDKAFYDACVKAGIVPTMRQASKYRRACGKAYAATHKRVLALFSTGTLLDAAIRAQSSAH